MSAVRDDDRRPGAEPRPRDVEDQMVHDWAMVGLRRLERHLAKWSDFHDFLDRRSREDDNRGVSA